MKTQTRSIVVLGTLTMSLLLTSAPRSAVAQGMPVEARRNIHALFSQHTNFTRKVTMTKDGYVAVTESQDPRLARVLREHVGQMRERLQGGRMVRGWDPAFRELVEHYDDITHRVEATQHGLKITVTGKTPAAIQVAKSHAQIVSGFAKNGWAEHDVRHPRAVTPDPKAAAKTKAPPKACCLAEGGPAKGKQSCCGKDGCEACARPTVQNK